MQGPANQVVFVDANVWFSRTLRDWIGMFYTTPDAAPFEIRWTEDVLAEVLYHLRRTHPEWDGARITRVRDLIADTFENGRVDDFVIGSDYKGKDGLDAHVHAAAVACGADILLTTNVADFSWTRTSRRTKCSHLTSSCCSWTTRHRSSLQRSR